MNIVYKVECWSNCKRIDPFGDLSHWTDVVHIASSLQKAKEFCAKHPDFCGIPGGERYVPFTWRIFSCAIDEDEFNVVHSKARYICEIDPTKPMQPIPIVIDQLDLHCEVL